MKTQIILISLILLLGMASAANTLLGGTLNVQALKYTPYPAEPGKYMDLWLNIMNEKYVNTGVSCTLEPEFPFSIDNNDLAQRNIGTIPAGQDFVLKYKVRVDPQAVLGDNEIKLTCKSDYSPPTTAKITVNIKLSEGTLEINNVNTPEIAPGNSGKITFEIKNYGRSTLKDISAKLDLSSADLPIAPLNGTSEQKLQFLDAGATHKLEYNLISSPTAPVKPYKIPVEITYYDETGAKYTISDYIGLVISSKANLFTKLDSSEIIRQDSTGKITIRFVNTGLGDVKFLSSTLGQSADYDIIGSQSTYIGNIASDDYQTVEYDIHAKGKAGETIMLPLTVTYSDINNNQYNAEQKLALRLYTEDEIKTLKLEPSQGINPIILLIVLAAIAYIGYRFIRKRK